MLAHSKPESFAQALLDVFPDIGLDISKFEQLPSKFIVVFLFQSLITHKKYRELLEQRQREEIS